MFKKYGKLTAGDYSKIGLVDVVDFSEAIVKSCLIEVDSWA